MARPKKYDDTEQLQLRIPTETKKELKLLAVMHDTSMIQIFLDGFELYKKKHQSKQK